MVRLPNRSEWGKRFYICKIGGKSDESRITACEMKFMRQTAGYTKWDLKRNAEVLK
jgi:hypothetical protein